MVLQHATSKQPQSFEFEKKISVETEKDREEVSQPPTAN